eukprot:Awhi_evm2s1189
MTEEKTNELENIANLHRTEMEEKNKSLDESMKKIAQLTREKNLIKQLISHIEDKLNETTNEFSCLET